MLLLIKADRSPNEISTLLRAAIVMLYAHWEGFIKGATEKYIKAINKRGLQGSQISYKWARHICCEDLIRIGESKKNSTFYELYKKIMGKQKSKCHLHEDIDTKSNLNSEIFRDILFLTEIDTEKYSTKFNLIDEVVNLRNNIAHGKGNSINVIKYEEIYHDIIDILDCYKNSIIENYYNDVFINKDVPHVSTSANTERSPGNP